MRRTVVAPSALAPVDDQVRLTQHPKMLGGGWLPNLRSLRQVADGIGAVPHSLKQPAPSRIGQCDQDQFIGHDLYKHKQIPVSSIAKETTRDRSAGGGDAGYRRDRPRSQRWLPLVIVEA